MQLSVLTTRGANMGMGTDVGSAAITMALLQDDGKIYAYMEPFHASPFGTVHQWWRTNNEPINAMAVAIGPVGVWCLDETGVIYLWNRDPDHSLWEKDIEAQDVTAISCDPDGDLWCLNKHGEVFVNHKMFAGLDTAPSKRWVMGSWEKVEAASTAILPIGKERDPIKGQFDRDYARLYQAVEVASPQEVDQAVVELHTYCETAIQTATAWLATNGDQRVQFEFGVAARTWEHFLSDTEAAMGFIMVPAADHAGGHAFRQEMGLARAGVMKGRIEQLNHYMAMQKALLSPC